MAGIQIPNQTNENDEPIFVLQNVSAMSRQVAQPKRRGWGIGWFQGGNNNNNNDSDDKNKNDTGEEEEKKLGDTSHAAKNIPQQNEVGSPLRQQSSSLSSSSSTQSETPSNNPLHPPSPKLLSPRISSSKKASVSEEITNKRSITNKKNNNNKEYSHPQNSSSTTAEKELLFERKMREKRRKKNFQRIEWYEEDLQERVSRDGIHLLTEDDVIALGLFNAQRLGEEELGDVELNQLLILADLCKQAQKDEAELEMLLEREEAGDEVDMDRVYHLELLSRRRMGEKLTDEENGELQLLEQKRQNENGNDTVDDIRLYELSLLDEKRKGVKHATDEELRQEEQVKLRCEDARVNQKDLNKLLQLKENTLRDEEHMNNIDSSMLLDKRDSGEDNYLDAERISELILLKRKRKGDILNNEEENQLSEIGNSQYNEKESNKEERAGSDDATFNEDEFDELLSRKEKGETIDENRLYELELLYRRRRREELTENEMMDLELCQLQRAEDVTLDNSKGDEEVNSVSTIGEWSFSPSELLDLDDIHRELKQEGLPLKFSFFPFSEENEYEMSVVSSGDESYVQDLVNQKENREDNRKEECLEDAYKLYKRTIKEKKLPENEGMLLTLFENILKKKNDKMRKKDAEFDELVDKVLAQHALSKQDIRKNAQSEEEKLTESIKILPGKERIKTNALEDAKRTMRAKAEMEQEKQSRRQIVKQSMVDADDDEKMAVIIHSKISNQQPSISENQDSENKNESQERTERGWGIGRFRRNATNSTKGEEVSQTKEVDAQIGGKESTIDNSENNEERNDASLSKIDSSEIEEKTEKVSDVKRGWGKGFFGRIENTSTKTDDISETEEAENVDMQIETRESESEERKEENLENAEEIDVKQMCLSTEGSQNIKEGGGMFFFGFGGKRNDKTTKVDGEIVLEPEEQEFDDLGNESGDKVTHVSDAEEETIETAPVNHPLSNDTQKLVDSDTLENENCHLEEKNNKPQEIAKRFGFFRFVAKEKEDTTNDDERKSLQSKEHAVEGSIDEESNVQENKATVSDISFAKDDDDLYENTVVVVGIPRTIKMDFAEEKKNSEEPIQDIYDLVKCGTETFSKDAEHDYVPSTIDFLDNDIQYNKFMERLHNGKSLEDDEEYELKLLKRIKQGGTLNDSEIEELKMLRKSREQLDQNIETIDNLHKGRDIDDNFDYNQYQSLMEQMKSGATLHENEFFELALLERMNRGEYLQDDEIEELKMLRQIREQLDQNMEAMESMETLCQEKESGPDKFDKQSMEQVQTREVDHELHEPDSLECTIQGKARQDLEMEDQNAVRQSIEQDDQNKKDIHNLHKGVDIEFYSDDDPRHELENDEQHRQEADTYDRKDEEKDKNNIISTEACGEELFVKEYQSESNSVDITEQDQEEEDDDDVEEEDKNNITHSSDIRGKEVFDKEDLFQSKSVEKTSNSKTLHMEDQNEHTVSDAPDESSVLKIRGEEIDKDLLYELELLIRKRDGEQFSNSQNFELDVLRQRWRGETPSELQNVELFKRDRTETILGEDYLQDLLDRSSRGEPVNKDLQYEVKLLHKHLDGETLSEDELLELYFSERRINGDMLTQDDLDELDLLRRRRLNLNSTDGQSDTVEMSMAEEEDSVYRRDLLERQKAGSRLSKIEFQWLQILMKKYRNEELLEDDYDELRMMRNQRNETGSPEVEFVNTKRLLEEEVKKKAKRELKEKRRKEKEERREQRSKRIKQKQLDRKIMRENKKREGDQGKRISESTRGTHSENKNQPDVLSRLDTANSVQIIGSPSMQPPGSRGDDKAEPKRGVFGGVFGTNKKKERKMQELAEAKRLQEELIKEQMKALALDNEVEELEREKVMQEQLIQETIERKIADASVGSSSWETDSIDKNMESEDDSSSLSSSDSSLSDSSSEPGEIFGSKEGLIIPKKIDYEAGNEDEHGNQVEHHQKLKHLDSASSDIANFPIESSHESNELGKIPTHNALISGQRLSTKTGKLGIPKNSDEEVRRSEDIKNRTKSLSLGAHLKRQKKKSGVRKTKYGDDVSLGTLQLSKVIKVESDRSRHVKIHPDFANKTHERPWIAATIPNTQVKSTKNEKTGSTGISDNSYQFSQSVVSRISEADAKVESVTSFHSSNNEGDYINNVYNDIMEDSDLEKPPYESTSITSLDEEAYDLDIREYENIERTGVALNFISRLADKIESKKTEFDTTWENIVADETVVAQINQRLRERQRLKENMKEKKKQEKKEEEESNGLQDTPRLFLFEGEKVETKNKKRKKKKKNTRKTQRKLDKTLTKEFRKAMEEIFDSDSDDNYRHKTLSGEDFDDDDDGIQDYHIDPTRTRIQSYDDHRLYDDVSERSVSENDRAAVDSDEESEKFDGGYLKRLQARSMPQQVKQMLSGRNLTNYKSTYSESSDELSFSSDGEDQIYHSARRKYKRKKDGELANDDIDPAEIYAQELEKKKEKKAFTVAGLRKEMEDDLKQQLKQQQQQNNNNAKIGVGGFNIKPIPLNKKSKVPKPKNDLNLSTGMQRASQRFFATTSSDQGKRPPETIEEEDEDEEEEGGAFLTGGINSEDFGNVDSFKDNLMSYRSKLAWKKNINFGNAGSNLKSSLAVSIKNPFKAKKSPQIGGGGGGVDVAGGGGGGLLSIQEGGHNEEPPNHFNNNITGMGGFHSDNNNNNRISVLKAIGKMNSKNLLTKFKLPGKKSNNFGGGLMMDDDYDDDN